MFDTSAAQHKSRVEKSEGIHNKIMARDEDTIHRASAFSLTAFVIVVLSYRCHGGNAP